MATDPRGCPKCMLHYHASPFLVEAAASVGIEHGASTDETGGPGKISSDGGGER